MLAPKYTSHGHMAALLLWRQNFAQILRDILQLFGAKTVLHALVGLEIGSDSQGNGALVAHFTPAVCMHACMYECMYVCVCVCVIGSDSQGDCSLVAHFTPAVCMHACMDECMYVCMYVCMSV